MRPFCRKNHVHKIPRLGGGVFWFGGGECRFYFYGREDFSEIRIGVKDRIAKRYYRHMFWASGALSNNDCMP